MFISIALLIHSCSNINNDNSNDLIARAGENFLYQNELPSFLSLQDSLLRYKNFVELWAKEKLLYDLSLTNLSQSKKKELDLIIEKFKVDLYIDSYKDLIVNSRIDSIVTNEEIESYYNANIDNFTLNETLLKYRYLKVPSDNININTNTATIHLLRNCFHVTVINITIKCFGFINQSELICVIVVMFL